MICKTSIAWILFDNSYGGDNSEINNYIEETVSFKKSSKDFLIEQVNIAFKNELDRQIAFLLIDNLDRTKQSLENDEELKGSGVLKKTLEHINIVKKDLITIFKKNNIEEIISINKKLDPNLHQAMMGVEDDNKEPGTIVQEIQKGFKMKDRLLRPSLVSVSKKTEKSSEKAEKKVNNDA